MKWVSATSTQTSARAAVDELVVQIDAGMNGLKPDLLLVFFRAAHRPQYKVLVEMLDERFPDGLMVGCSGMGVIGSGHEFESGHAITVLAAHLPGVGLHPFYLNMDDIPDEDAPPSAWRERLGDPPGEDPVFLLLVDPFTANVERLLQGLDYAWPGSPKIGGLASGSGEAGGNLLILDRHTFHRGAVALVMDGPIQLDTIVAQGCRPIGQPVAVTKAHLNTITQLDGQPALEWLSQEMASQSDEDQTLAKTHLFIGLSMDPFNPSPGRGDFLIRNLIGVDYNNGSIVLGGLADEGQLIQFHLRDREAAHEDMESLLACHGEPVPDDAGLLLFSCLGRGEFLYRDSDHDSQLIESRFGPRAAAGFFCNGEIGPVGGSTFIHGYTTVLGILREADEA